MHLLLCLLSETEEKAKREQEEQQEATAKNREHKKDPELSGPQKDRVGEDDPEPGGVNGPPEESPHDKSKNEEAHQKLQNGIVFKWYNCYRQLS